jgi:hypothetical protein
MRASEVIEILQLSIEMHGDMKVKTADPESDYLREVERIKINTSGRGMPYVEIQMEP